jgi:hypothetical protein
MTPDECLALAWTHCAPGRSQSAQFPNGFWPDVARVAIEMYAQQTVHPQLSFRPTMCSRGDAPEPKRVSKSGVDLSRLEISI